ncbi:DotA/TraY family protein [Paucibacter soli]|uniref:DotA/TraY family protein n=1 Tax=Paucibacter soli TaxID=3133433 RepID=UPI0030A36012
MTQMQKQARAANWAALLMLLMVPALAMAQSSPNPLDSFDPSQKDMTRWIIAAVFGDWKSSSTVPMIGSAMRVLNLFALGFGTLMFTYVAVIGTLNSAQDGEVLGKKWSSMWIPVRFTAGTALLVPLASGYSTIQHTILWLALAGGGAASQVWSAAIENFSGQMQTQVITTPEFDSKVRLLMRDVLKAEYCSAKNSLRQSDSFGLNLKPAGEDSMADPMMGQVSSYNRVARWGALTDTSGKAADSCGSAKTSTFTNLNGSSYQLTPSQGLGGNYMDGGGFDDTAGAAKMNDLGRKVIDDQIQGLTVAAAKLRPLAMKLATAAEIAQKPDAEIISAIKEASTLYKAAISGSVEQAAKGFDTRLTKFTDASREAGWIMAGSTFFQMAQIKSSASKMMQQLPTMTAGEAATSDPVIGVTDTDSSIDMKAMETMIDKNFKGDESDWWNPGEKIVQIFMKVFGFDPNSGKHSLVQIKDTGDTIIVASETAAVSFLAVQTTTIATGNTAIGRVVDAVSGAKSTWSEIVGMLLPAIYGGFIAAFGVGITMAFVLPMLPFTLTVGSIVGWMMALFSAVVAGPVWLAGHLHPEGDDLAGKGVGGYMILLETVTRPIFIVFGLIGAFLLMDPVLKLVSLMFKTMMSSLQGNSTTGIVSIAVLSMLYVGIVFTTVRSVMSLVYVLSETVYRWIGGAHAGMEQAREFNQHAQQSAEVSKTQLQAAGAMTAASRRRLVGERDKTDEQKGALPKA